MYALKWWEIKAIIKGYTKRDRLAKDLLRLNAYCSFFMMRKNDGGLTPKEWITLPWESDESDDLISEEEAEEYKKMLIAENEKRKQMKATGTA